MLSSIALVAALLPSVLGVTSETVFELPNAEAIENFFIVGGDSLYVGTLAPNPLLYIGYVGAKSYQTYPRALPPKTALTALAPNAKGNLHAFIAGTQVSTSKWQAGSGWIGLYGPEGNVNNFVIPNAEWISGVAQVTGKPSLLLLSDSIGGNIYRINVQAYGVPAIAFSDPAFLPVAGKPHGIEGLKIRGDYLYFTNAGKGTFGRVQIDTNGNKVGSVQIIANAPTGTTYDDFAFDNAGNAYIAAHPNSILKVTPAGVQTTFAGGANSLFREPTSVQLLNDQSIVVGTAGDASTGGRIIKVTF